jgi:hypothetical protein
VDWLKPADSLLTDGGKQQMQINRSDAHIDINTRSSAAAAGQTR